MKLTYLLGLGLALTATPLMAQTPAKIRLGIVAAVDQVAAPVAVERGFFDKNGVDVTIAPAFASGVEALNALQAGDIQLAQVGFPLQAAIISGMDVVYVGGYMGTASRLRGDETLAILAREGSGIDPKDPKSLIGKKIAAPLNTASHLYLRNFLEAKGVAPGSYTLVNTSPPDMSVALSGRAVDAFVAPDPWPILGSRQNPGSYEAARGGGYVANVAYLVAMRRFAESNQDTLQRFLAGLAEGGQWARANIPGAAEIASRWVPGTDVKVAEQALRNVSQLLDGRMSGCTVAAMQENMEVARTIRSVQANFDVRRNVAPEAMIAVLAKRPELFADLPPIPAPAVLKPGAVGSLDLGAATTACLEKKSP